MFTFSAKLLNQHIEYSFHSYSLTVYYPYVTDMTFNSYSSHEV